MPKKLSGLERRNVILDEASRIFAFKGLHGATTKEIAKASGISEPVLYQHFKSKEEIYTTLETLCGHQTAYFKRVIQDRGLGIDSLITITYLLVRVISFCKEPGTKSKPAESGSAEILLRLMGYSFLEDGTFARTLVENCIGAFFDQWLESYKRSLDEGLLNVDKADSVALWLAYESIIGMGLFVLPTRRLVDRIKDPNEAAKAATLFVLRGIGVKESVIRQKVHWPELRKVHIKAMEEASHAF